MEFLSRFQVCFRFYFYRIKRTEPRGLSISSDSAVKAQALGKPSELAGAPTLENAPRALPSLFHDCALKPGSFLDTAADYDREGLGTDRSQWVSPLL